VNDRLGVVPNVDAVGCPAFVFPATLPLIAVNKVVRSRAFGTLREVQPPVVVIDPIVLDRRTSA
jgi:hypothetical protein